MTALNVQKSPPLAATAGEEVVPVVAENILWARRSILILSTSAFTLLFAVWLMFGILSIPIRAELNLTDMELSWLTAIAILNGAIWRLTFGLLADRFGGRMVMVALLLASAVPAFMVVGAHTYGALLLCAFFVGLAGNGFAVGISWNSAWFPRQSQGFALGVFRAGNVGASVTKLIAPGLMVAVPLAGFHLMGIQFPGGWRIIPLIYGTLLVLMAAAVFLFTPKTDRTPGKGRPIAELLRPLKSIRVWRFSLYYVAVFGVYVALSVWLPKYYSDVYHASFSTAALLTALFIFPASLLRPFGGMLADHFGARRVMYAVFTIMSFSTLILALPPFNITLDGSIRSFHFDLGIVGFTILVFLLGVGMGVGKAAVYKYIPEYFPKDIGAVGGMVGLLGALGGFFLPPVFAYTQSLTHLPQMTFAALFLLIGICFAWLHVTVLGIVRKASPQVQNQFEVSPGPA